MRVDSRAWLALATAVAALPSTAHAYEDQLGLWVEGGYAAVISDADLPHHGFATALGASYGLGDTWELRASATYGLQLDPPAERYLHRVVPSVELVYLIDILEVVPFVGLGIDVPISVFQNAGVERAWVDFAGHAVVGLDWLPERTWSIGLEVRPYLFFTSLEADPMWLTVMARVQWLIELL